jgi:sigma-B regulation protein RsbU (phosphoserine phosphatase)
MLEIVPLAQEMIIRQLSAGIVILDLGKNIQEINPAAIGLLGIPAQSYEGRSFLSVVQHWPELAAQLSSRLTASPGQERKVVVKFSASRRALDVSVTTVDDRRGEAAGWLIQLTDTSEQEQAEIESEETRVAYLAVLDSLQDSYFEADPAGVLTYVNEAFAKTVGLSRKQELIGKHFRHITARAYVRRVYEGFRRVFETNQAIDPFEFVYRTANGTEYTSEIVVSPILENGQAIGTRGIVRDISARVKAEEMLRQAKEAAEYRAGELASINRVAVIVSRSLDLRDILQSVCQELTAMFAVRNAGIGLLTADRQGLEIIAFHAIDPAEKSALGMVLPLDGNAASQDVIRHKKTVVIQDSQTDTRTTSVSDISRLRGTRAIMIVPLLTRGEAIGTIGLPARDPDHVFTPAEIELTETIASQIAAAVDNAKLHTQTERALGVAERDLEIGRQIQSGFFPEKLPAVPGWEIAAHFDAARQVAGDFYDVFQFRSSNYTAFIIADVCDKGVGAALFMVLVRSLLRAFSETSLHSGSVETQLANIVTNTSDFIARYHGKSNMFATLFFGILDPTCGRLYYVNGGHEPPVILDQHGAIIHRLMPTGPAVGIFPDMVFRVEQCQLEAGDSLVGYTDGTTDAKDLAGRTFSEERLLACLASPWTSIFSLLFDLKTELKRHMGAQTQFDDITLIAFRRQLAAVPVRHAICRPARLECLEELRGFVEAAARYDGLSAGDVFAFKLVVDELCTNIIQYGYAGHAPGLLSLAFELDGPSARLIIQDDGQHYEPGQAPAPDLQAGWEERESGGLGLHFVREMMDEVVYTRVEPNVNQFRLEKILTGPNLKKE